MAITYWIGEISIAFCVDRNQQLGRGATHLQYEIKLSVGVVLQKRDDLTGSFHAFVLVGDANHDL